MADIGRSGSWREELASLVDDGLRYNNNNGDPFVASPIPSLDNPKQFNFDAHFEGDTREQEEDLKDQIKGFAKAWGELLLDLSRGCKDIVQQSLVAEDSYFAQNFGPPLAKISNRLCFLNDYLPEDRDPVHVWPVIFFVFILAFAVLNVNNAHQNPAPIVKKMLIHPPNASTVLLPDGRHIAYLEQGLSGNRARFTLISPHAFLSSRLSGIPGIKASLLEEFGVRLITYDLPGFGESDPDPSRNLNSSAMDMQHLANALALKDKFWVFGHSSAAMHAWAAIKFISNRIAGAAFVAPMVNPYESSMTKEETSKTWEKWEQRRKFMFSTARRFPSFLSHFYRRSFFSGKHGTLEKWFSLTLGEKDKALIEKESFEEFWQRDVEESVRQGRMKSFIEESVLQVSDWGFSLADLQMRRRCPGTGILPWLKSIYRQAECELTGFSGPIHIWQGLDDHVVPPSMAQYISRILPGATLYMLPSEGHFSYLYFCDECHRQILSTLFGDPRGPLDYITDLIDTDQSLANTPEEDAPGANALQE
ncbi:uncharacterized protein LOC110717269 [Chenopodium quinoa]|uniref:AB hydrolase-1 domain-containing protein n=1 Tax=Chenopodium quinoa TaxID=63459 RepID=A0A803N3X3_CHEQI|nr:uncharacterized protein LOC110717269 [Chenopodium quinoa]